MIANNAKNLLAYHKLTFVKTAKSLSVHSKWKKANEVIDLMMMIDILFYDVHYYV